MDPKTLAGLVFVEELIALAAKTVADIRSVIQGSNTQTVDAILEDADAQYKLVIQNAQRPVPPPPGR